jgi:hypothetical protein
MKTCVCIICLFGACLLKSCRLSAGREAYIQPIENVSNECFGLLQNGETISKMTIANMGEFRRLLDLSAEKDLDISIPANAFIKPAYPDCSIYIKDEKGVIIKSEYILPNGDFFSRKWKDGDISVNRSAMLKLIKPEGISK